MRACAVFARVNTVGTKKEQTMHSGALDGPLNFVMVSSGCAALLLIALNAWIYGLTEGKDGPYVKQMVACLVAATVFVLSGIVKLFQWVL